ncbi:cardiolipin synthase [Desulfovibrio psychrotolerans]|nr:cardiolipin synthase [Desulfovibrio psychrotolerans]
MNTLVWLLIPLTFIMAAAVAGHALVHKREPRAALGWVAVCLTFPIAGPLLYYVFGINRVRRSALKLREEALAQHVGREWLHGGPEPLVPVGALDEFHIPPRYREFERVGRSATGMPLCGGNCMEPLFNGEQAFPRMLQAIEQAQTCVYLSTYIMETGPQGRAFVDALARAVRRGVDVRVLIDGVGEKYSWPRASTLLRRQGVPVAIFLPPRLIPPQLSINLRNHRKVLVTDGLVGFTGGMNIGRRHLADNDNPRRVTDVHFRFMGPVVAQLQGAFLEDWGVATGRYTAPLPIHEQCEGDCLCRVITDGPDNPLDPMASVIIAVISTARRSVRIMTPYFLPSRDLMSALQSAVLRGVDVRIVLPGKNNLPFVHWATRNMLWELLQRGVRVFYQPPPFCHTKLLIVDGSYLHVGSANMDPRSLRLNFELTVEVLDVNMGRQMSRHFDRIQRASREVTLEEVDSRSLPVRLRDAFFWLFSPYM